MIGIRLEFNSIFEKFVTVSIELCVVVQTLVALYLHYATQWLNSNLGHHRKNKNTFYFKTEYST